MGSVCFQTWQMVIKAVASGTDKRCFLGLWWNRYGVLSIYNRILIFTPEFPHIPRKISAYLWAGSPSDANTRIVRGFCNILNINDLCLRDISSYCKKHRFGLRNGLFRVMKSTISHPKTGFIASRNGQYRNAERAFSDYDTGYIKRRFRQKQAS